MPVQKGKKRKRIRNRGELGPRPDEARPAATSAKPVAKPAQARRRGWQLPPWLNAVFGSVMLGAGILFFALPQRGMSQTNRLFILILYILVAGFYFFRAYRGYRSKPS